MRKENKPNLGKDNCLYTSDPLTAFRWFFQTTYFFPYYFVISEDRHGCYPKNTVFRSKERWLRHNTLIKRDINDRQWLPNRFPAGDHWLSQWSPAGKRFGRWTRVFLDTEQFRIFMSTSWERGNWFDNYQKALKIRVRLGKRTVIFCPNFRFLDNQDLFLQPC